MAKKLVYTKYESFFIVNKQFTWGTKTNDTNYGKEVKLVKKEKKGQMKIRLQKENK